MAVTGRAENTAFKNLSVHDNESIILKNQWKWSLRDINYMKIK